MTKNIFWVQTYHFPTLFHILLFMPSVSFSVSLSPLYFNISFVFFFSTLQPKKYEALLNHFWCLVHLSQWHCWTRSEYSYMEQHRKLAIFLQDRAQGVQGADLRFHVLKWSLNFHCCHVCTNKSCGLLYRYESGIKLLI